MIGINTKIGVQLTIIVSNERNSGRVLIMRECSLGIYSL